MSLVLPRERSNAGSRWGPALSDYLDLPEANLEFEQLPSEQTLCRAIDVLLNEPGAVTFTTLQIIASVIYRPMLLRLLVHENAVDGCMELLENYASRNSSNDGLFEHAFGFLALHVLALVLQAGLLDGFGNYINDLPRVLTEDMDRTWDLKAPAIQFGFVERLLGLIAGCTLRPDWSPIITDYKIEWLEDSNEDDPNERACLPSIGGFTYCNAVFILQQLYEDRNMFLECCFRTRAPGWSILIYMIQFMLDDRSYVGRKIPDLWRKQRDLIHRFSLVSGRVEDSIFQVLTARYMEQSMPNFLGSSAAVDFEDAQLIQLAFTRKYRPNGRNSHKRDLVYETGVTFYVRDNVAKHQPLQLATSETGTEILWDVLLCVGQDSRWQDVDAYMGVIYGEVSRMLSKSDMDLTSKIIATMHKYDIVSMFGRYLLLPSYLENTLPGIVNAAPTTDLEVRTDGLRAVTSIGEAFGRVLRHAETPILLDNYYPDWYKTLSFIRCQTGIYPRGSYLHVVTAESASAWMDFGNGLGFMDHLLRRSPATCRAQQCMYARCADPELARFGTGNGIRYCSVRCQVA
ncbi:hypothetical protein FRC09_004246 [Ceratobasidium sp. 395]|nr:hypothetical protein FRC09_004246 [Ceratobasidium sp. 395]